MRDLWNLFRGNQPRLERLRYTFEKAGLVFENQPIPWCAETVVVHALVDVPAASTPPADFQLRVGNATWPVEQCRPLDTPQTLWLTFRLDPPSRPAVAELVWRNRSLGQVVLPVVNEPEFLKKLQINMPTTSVRLAAETVACHTYVSTQCQGWVAAALLRSSMGLAPVVDLNLRVAVARPEGGVWATVPVHMSSSQLAAEEALVSVTLPKPRRTGTWDVCWLLGDKTLSRQSLRAISRQQFHRSLQVCAARFVTQDRKGMLHVTPVLENLEGVRRVGPCFLLASAEPGMAARCKLQMRVHLKEGGQSFVLEEQEVLITDGPTPWAPGTVDASEVDQIKQFELRCGRDLLGTLPLTPAPTAAFTSEGGFVPPDPFEWTPAADEELKDRLHRLLR